MLNWILQPIHKLVKLDDSIQFDPNILQNKVQNTTKR